MISSNAKRLSCPSAPIKKGNKLLGKFGEDNTLIFDKEVSWIDESLIKNIGAGNAEFRATMSCAQKGCMNWSGEKCTVPDQMYQYLMPKQINDKIENCPIQKSCRWFAQDGEKACSICPLIRTEYYSE